MTAIESRKWAPTSHGLRPVSTVLPPSSACAGMPREHRRREPGDAGPAWALPQRADEAEDGDQSDNAREQAVAVLDDTVDAHLGRSNEGVFGAARPGRAAEARRGEAHGAAGDDDADIGHDRPEREPAQGGGPSQGQDPAASPRDQAVHAVMVRAARSVHPPAWGTPIAHCTISVT